MAEVKPDTPPSEEGLQRELEQLRTAQPAAPPRTAQPSVGQVLKKTALRMLILWIVLVVGFLAVWQLVIAPSP